MFYPIRILYLFVKLLWKLFVLFFLFNLLLSDLMKFASKGSGTIASDVGYYSCLISKAIFSDDGINT